MYVHVCIYIYTYTCMCVYIYIYIEREIDPLHLHPRTGSAQVLRFPSSPAAEAEKARRDLQ